MSNEFYKKYYQKGGTYVIPVEIFDELLEENKRLKQWDKNKDIRNSRQRIANKKLIKEIAELKKKLKVPETCNLKTLEDYKSYYEDTTREQILADTYIDYCAYVNLAHECAKIKKQLEEKIKIGVADHKYASQCEDKVITMETQQQEFIKYLENQIEINTPKTRWKHYNEDGFNDYDVENGGYIENQPVNVTLKEILQKYKEIIGGKDE